ncbi:hypothetical protein DY000_02038717 [Brassica cretica]|uniref:Uncharacterized protein n=1 Tax=Brassica cretica TaxID=69181 RepID=A0ABQ7BF38_BRACR|nr:hypothetical protein DY000_02038717 [Brassica cretica]
MLLEKKSRSSPLQVKVGLSDDVTMAEPPTATNEISTSVSNSLKVDLLSTSTVTTVHSSVSTKQSPLATPLVTGKEAPSLETTTLPPTEPFPCFGTIPPNYIALPQKHSPLLINPASKPHCPLPSTDAAEVAPPPPRATTPPNLSLPSRVPLWLSQSEKGKIKL